MERFRCHFDVVNGKRESVMSCMADDVLRKHKSKCFKVTNDVVVHPVERRKIDHPSYKTKLVCLGCGNETYDGIGIVL